MNAENATLELARRFVSGASATEAAVVEALIERHASGVPLEDLVDELVAGSTRRRSKPGEIGLHEIVAVSLPVVVPALWEIVKHVAAQFGEKGAEKVVDVIAAKLAGSPTDVMTEQAWQQLEAECKARAKELQLGPSSYESFLREARRRPEMLLKK